MTRTVLGSFVLTRNVSLTFGFVMEWCNAGDLRDCCRERVDGLLLLRRSRGAQDFQLDSRSCWPEPYDTSDPRIDPVRVDTGLDPMP